MIYKAPFNPDDIDRAGLILADAVGDGTNTELDEAKRLVDAWRRSHGHPINTLRIDLWNLRKGSGKDGRVTQRLKRLPSIIRKLKKIPRLRGRLSQLQDIGGCRVMVPQTDDVYDIAARLADSRIRHLRVKHSDYITKPPTSGYRSLHLVYQYQTDRKPEYDGLKIEIQLRSRLQHLWATAVEAVGTYIGQELKSGCGDKNWLRFFELMGTVIALREGYPIVPNTPSNSEELASEIRECDEKANIITTLFAIQEVSDMIKEERSSSRGSNLVLELNIRERSVWIRRFSGKRVDAANNLYMEREQATQGDSEIDVVLVYARTLATLRNAYPNYFMDIAGFRQLVSETVGDPSS